MAIKFFLYLPALQPSKARFFGGQLKDRLDLKLEKLVAKQLAHDIPTDLIHSKSCITRALWLTGQLCYPVKDFLAERFPYFLPLGINPYHAKGWWARVAEIPEVFAYDQFLVLTKAQWIAPPGHLKSLRVHALSPTEIAAIAEPTFVLRYSKDGEPIDRGFIVPQNWAADLLR